MNAVQRHVANCDTLSGMIWYTFSAPVFISLGRRTTPSFSFAIGCCCCLQFGCSCLHLIGAIDLRSGKVFRASLTHFTRLGHPRKYVCNYQVTRNYKPMNEKKLTVEEESRRRVPAWTSGTENYRRGPDWCNLECEWRPSLLRIIQLRQHCVVFNHLFIRYYVCSIRAFVVVWFADIRESASPDGNRISSRIATRIKREKKEKDKWDEWNVMPLRSSSSAEKKRWSSQRRQGQCTRI